MPYREKFSEKCLRALSSWNRTWEGVGSTKGEKEDVLEQRGFRYRVDFHLSAIEQLTERKRERERERERERDKQKSTNIVNINKI